MVGVAETCHVFRLGNTMFTQCWFGQRRREVFLGDYQWSWTMQPKHVGAFQVTSSQWQALKTSSLPVCQNLTDWKQGKRSISLSPKVDGPRRAVILSDSNYHIPTARMQSSSPHWFSQQEPARRKIGRKLWKSSSFFILKFRDGHAVKLRTHLNFLLPFLGGWVCLFFVLLEVPMSSDPWGIPVTQMLLAPRLGPFPSPSEHSSGSWYVVHGISTEKAVSGVNQPGFVLTLLLTVIILTSNCNHSACWTFDILIITNLLALFLIFKNIILKYY